MRCSVNNGQIIRFDSKVVLSGKTTLISYVQVLDNSTEEVYLDGFIRFVHVDLTGRALPHGIVIESGEPEDIALRERALVLT
jgi:acyl-CoA hydrolase